MIAGRARVFLAGAFAVLSLAACAGPDALPTHTAQPSLDTIVQARESSGVLVAPHGLVITNAHAVRGCASIQVVLSDASGQTAQVLAMNEDSDVAVLEIPRPPSARLATADRAAGYDEPLEALGFAPDPMGVSVLQSVTAPAGVAAMPARGVVWAVMRGRAQPGMSGGPVVDSTGRLVGLVAADFGDGAELTLLAPPHAIIGVMLQARRSLSITPGNGSAHPTAPNIVREAVVRVLC